MGAGKSTVAKYLTNNFNYFSCALGEKIHSECRLHGNETREEMQQYGQAMRKIFGENIWCDYLYTRYGNKEKIVIDDARQINEFYYFLAKNYLPIAVITQDDIRLQRLQKRVDYVIDVNTFNHETEVQARKCVSMCDIKIYNDSTNEDLYKEIENKLLRYIDG
jgi:dephospho-CoA kinase